MRKAFTAVMITVIGALGIAGCSTDNKSNDGPTVVIKDPTTTTSGIDETKVLACYEVSVQITDGLEAMSEGMSLLPYVSDAEAREFLATAREFVTVSKAAVKECEEFAPTQVRELLTALDSLDTALAEIEDLY